MKTIHVIVATGEWGQDQLRYRRHRLAEFLQKQPDTEEVIWLCPAPRKEKRPVSLLSNGIKQWSIQDLLPHKFFRFGRYIDNFYKKKLKTLLMYLKKAKGKFALNLWYTFPGFPLLSDLISWDHVVYDCSDLWAAPIGGQTSSVSRIRQEIISRAEKRIIQEAEWIFCTSDYLREQVVEQSNHLEKVITFENGVEFDLFSEELVKMEDLLPANFEGTVLGFIGGIKPKLDFKLLRETIEKKSNWLFLFVGPDQTNNDSEFKAILTEKNVLWTGSVSPFDVPKYMNCIDIGIMPYKESPYNKAVFPLKLFEFLAAGKPVVGVNLPSTTKYSEYGIYNHVNTDDFIEACEQFDRIKHEQKLTDLRQERAREKNWNEVFSEMLQILTNQIKNNSLSSS